ncbi:unnamed protein product [Cylicostephanus goldi]|uniref:Uncharacterized protein n=1 Tax=Cylicostephanus goldi TaxID=71465 RepID=A0A3P6SMK7_CYLGO|nr:unnamed protein product [Cylicostephanus goldi]
MFNYLVLIALLLVAGVNTQFFGGGPFGGYRGGFGGFGNQGFGGFGNRGFGGGYGRGFGGGFGRGGCKLFSSKLSITGYSDLFTGLGKKFFFNKKT